MPSLVSTRDEVRHGQLRRSVASGFTARGAAGYEGFVDTTVPELMAAIRRGEGRVDLSRLMLLIAWTARAGWRSPNRLAVSTLARTWVEV